MCPAGPKRNEPKNMGHKLEGIYCAGAAIPCGIGMFTETYTIILEFRNSFGTA